MSPAEKAVPKYDTITVALHWTTAVLVVVLWTMGQTAGLIPRGGDRAAYWSLHVILGFVLAVILIGRLAWRGFGGRRLVPVGSAAFQRLVEATHVALYVLLIGVVVLGVANAFVRGFTLFDLVSLPQFGDPALKRPLRNWHGLGAHLLLALAFCHAAAALAHHYLLKDDVLRRMLPGRS